MPIPGVKYRLSDVPINVRSHRVFRAVNGVQNLVTEGVALVEPLTLIARDGLNPWLKPLVFRRARGQLGNVGRPILDSRCVAIACDDIGIGRVIKP